MKANEATIESPQRFAQRRVRRALGAAVVGLFALSACSSNPGPKRVAQDIIESESEVNPELEKDCLLAELDEFSDADLKAIAKLLEKDAGSEKTEGEADLAEFEAALRRCSPE